MKIAIIGGGAAGLASLKHSLDEGHECTVFEQTGHVGGTWNYVESVGVDEYGLPIHSSMYEGLRTNLPKELMQYENFQYKEPEASYISQAEVLTYMNNYANFFNLLPHIKFFNHVLQIDPLPEGKWVINVKDLKRNATEEEKYDAVFVCVGNYSVPKTPDVQDMDKFNGRIIHSHSYRKPDSFKGSRVLVVGAGPSGCDIANMVSEVADKVLISIKPENKPFGIFNENVFIKPEIKKFGENSVIFEDDTEEGITDVIFCTGYLHTYPFLSAKCGIEVENNWVKYLYKQIINIAHPTMGFIGLPFRICPFPLFDIQVKFFLTFLKGNIRISKQQMLQELDEYMEKKKQEGDPLHHAHKLGLNQGLYMEDLAETACVTKVPPVIQTLYEYYHKHGKGKYNLLYRILNETEYTVEES